MIEIIFLFALALIWIIFAVIQDLKSKEIANWLNFSLIAFALGFRFFYSLFALESFNFLYQGLIGLGIFFVIGNLFYYTRIFAGGDAKLMIALGSVLFLYGNFLSNIKVLFLFLLLFLFIGAIYGLSASFFFVSKNFKNFKKEFLMLFKKNKILVFFAMFFGLILMLFGFKSLFFIVGVVLFIFPYFFIYTKSIDEACMVKKLKTNQLREGDWLYRDLKVGRKLIKANWEGLSKEDIREIKKKHKKVLIRQGVAFSPVFLISFLIIIYIYFFNSNLMNLVGFTGFSLVAKFFLFLLSSLFLF